MSAEQKGGASISKKFSQEAKGVLENTPLNGYTTVAVELFSPHTESALSTIADQASFRERKALRTAIIQAGKKDISGVTQILDQVKEFDDEVDCIPYWVHTAVVVTGPKGLINMLADRQDVKRIDLPAESEIDEPYALRNNVTHYNGARLFEKIRT